jgi:hypothetical protein
MRRLLLSALTLVFLVSAASSQTYSITDLGPLQPTAINSWAQVVGSLHGQAYLWSPIGGLERLGLLPGGTSSTPTAINDFGVVVGEADGTTTVTGGEGGGTFTCPDVPQGFEWTKSGGMQGQGLIVIGDMNPCTGPANLFAYASGINEGGKVIGTINWADNTYVLGYSWRNLTEGIDILPFPSNLNLEYPLTVANGINIRGQIAGAVGCCVDLNQGHALFWDDNKDISDLGTLGGPDSDFQYYCSDARGINDAAQIVGWSTTVPATDEDLQCDAASSEVPRAFSWTKSGGMLDLGTLPGDSISMAYAINSWGQVIGTSGNRTMLPQYRGVMGIEVVGHPFIWTQQDGIHDLNSLIPSSSGWVLKTATGINFFGQIVGSGIHNGRMHGFLLTPQFRACAECPIW